MSNKTITLHLITGHEKIIHDIVSEKHAFGKFEVQQPTARLYYPHRQIRHITIPYNNEMICSDVPLKVFTCDWADGGILTIECYYISDKREYVEVYTPMGILQIMCNDDLLGYSVDG